MRLSDLEPELLKRLDESSSQIVEKIAEADGISFLCPVCYKRNNGAVGTHRVICWCPQIPQSVTPGPGRWRIEGTSFADISLVANPTSVELVGGCNAHFIVRNGEIIAC